MKSLQNQQKPAEEEPLDDGSGKLEIWRIENFHPAPIDRNSYGQFFSGDSYLILYTYKINGKDAWVIYMWQGLQTSIDERAACALHAKGKLIF